MPNYLGVLSEEERRRVLASAGADYGPYLDLVRKAATEHAGSKQHKFGLAASEVGDRRAHKRRLKAAADMAGYTLDWVPDPQKKIPPDELWARLYKHGSEPAKRRRKGTA
jgi:hypothetical protein